MEPGELAAGRSRRCFPCEFQGEGEAKEMILQIALPFLGNM